MNPATALWILAAAAACMLFYYNYTNEMFEANDPSLRPMVIDRYK